MNGVAVSTRVPPNLFSFRAGESITIAGGTLVDSGLFRHRLLATDGAKKFDEKSSYEIKADLASQEMISDEEVLFNCSFCKQNMGFVFLDMIFIFSCTMW